MEEKGGMNMKKRLSILLTCVLVLLILAMPVGAEVRSGYVSNLLAPLYGSSQTKLIDKIGYPIGSTATAGGYTLSVDAVIGDRYHTAVVYTLSRVDGSDIPSDARFQDHPIAFQGHGGGGSVGYYPSPDRKELKIVEKWTSNMGMLFNRQVHSTFTNLTFGDQVVEGSWELKFAARFRNSMTKIPVKNLNVQDSKGQEFTIHKLYLSPIGLHMDMTSPNFFDYQGPDKVSEPSNPMEGFRVSLQMMDGSFIAIKDWNCGYRSSVGASTAKADFGAMFDQPIELKKVAAVHICDQVIPISH